MPALAYFLSIYVLLWLISKLTCILWLAYKNKATERDYLSELEGREHVLVKICLVVICRWLAVNGIFINIPGMIENKSLIKRSGPLAIISSKITRTVVISLRSSEMQAHHLIGCFLIPVCSPACSSCSSQVDQVFHLATRPGHPLLPAPPPWLTSRALPGQSVLTFNAPHVSSY